MTTTVRPLNTEAYLRLTFVTVFVIVVLGGAMGFFSRWFYLVLLFPLIAGCVVGGMVALSSSTYGIRNRAFLFGWALVVSFSLYATYHFTEYLVLLSQLSETAARPTFIEYLRLNAAIGTMIGRQGGSGDPMFTLMANSTYLLWAVETLLCCGSACWIAVSSVETRKSTVSA